MKNLVNKSIGVLLILVILCSTLTGCFGESNEERTYVYGDIVLRRWGPHLNAKLESSVSTFSKKNATFDLFVSVYDIDNPANYVDDLPEIYRLCIFVSNNDTPPYKNFNPVYQKSFNDVENAELIREISYDEAFNTDFGYTIDEDSWAKSINYNHKEKITIPEYFFTPEHECICIHVIEFNCRNYDDKGNKIEDGLIVEAVQRTSICILYALSDDTVVFKREKR